MMIVNFHIRKYIRKFEDLTLKQVEKEESRVQFKEFLVMLNCLAQ